MLREYRRIVIHDIGDREGSCITLFRADACASRLLKALASGMNHSPGVSTVAMIAQMHGAVTSRATAHWTATYLLIVAVHDVPVPAVAGNANDRTCRGFGRHAPPVRVVTSR
jgi:hypothetical protein